MGIHLCEEQIKKIVERGKRKVIKLQNFMRVASHTHVSKIKHQELI